MFAPTAPLAIPLPDAELEKIVGAYTDNPSNTNYKFTHLFLSVTHPAMRGRHVAVAEDMWQAAMRQLEGMSAEERERLWPEVAMGFKALSNRLKLQVRHTPQEKGRSGWFSVGCRVEGLGFRV